MSDPTKELIFQNEVIAQMIAGGWKRGNATQYDRALELYPEDVVGFVKETQPDQWEKFCRLYPTAPEQKFIERVAEQLNKADPLAANQTMRTFGTLIRISVHQWLGRVFKPVIARSDVASRRSNPAGSPRRLRRLAMTNRIESTP